MRVRHLGRSRLFQGWITRLGPYGQHLIIEDMLAVPLRCNVTRIYNVQHWPEILLRGLYPQIIGALNRLRILVDKSDLINLENRLSEVLQHNVSSYPGFCTDQYWAKG